ncbi:hypothetical protein J6590_075342 [Homalodisca vitripennis]|nr:hypothetical protein J6590_075342 [Homalodisca vitripennis]
MSRVQCRRRWTLDDDDDVPLCRFAPLRISVHILCECCRQPASNCYLTRFAPPSTVPHTTGTISGLPSTAPRHRRSHCGLGNPAPRDGQTQVLRCCMRLYEMLAQLHRAQEEFNKVWGVVNPEWSTTLATTFSPLTVMC